jgi:hypothetical protein
MKARASAWLDGGALADLMLPVSQASPAGDFDCDVERVLN